MPSNSDGKYKNMNKPTDKQLEKEIYNALFTILSYPNMSLMIGNGLFNYSSNLLGQWFENNVSIPGLYFRTLSMDPEQPKSKQPKKDNGEKVQSLFPKDQPKEDK